MITRFAATNSILLATLMLMAASVVAAKDNAGLSVGDAAPVFTVSDDSGKEWSSADIIGKKIVVVYFYPADMTGGCTKQACGFRDDMQKLTDDGVVVVGVSGDSVRNHQLFKKAHHLNFALLADVDGAVAKAFGVPYTEGEKTVTAEIDGKQEKLVRKVTSQRWTFVIGLDGKVALKNDKVKAADDSKAVLELVAKLKK